MNNSAIKMLEKLGITADDIQTRMTKKQSHVQREYVKNNPRMLVLYGAIRSGKTFLAVFLFIALIRANKGKNETYIIGGVSAGTIRRNVLSVIEYMLNIEIRLNQFNAFNLFGNEIVCFAGADSAKWKAIRGFTAKGALINEATALDYSFVLEAIARCSLPQSRIIIDTNPDNPMHFVKRDLIDKSGDRLASGRINVMAYHFTLFDNELLDQEYIESIIASTASGVFTDRNIYGRWVAAQGAVYVDFNEENIISMDRFRAMKYVRKFAGVDWGFAHKGVICLWGMTEDDEYVRMYESVHRYKDITFWVDEAKKIVREHGDIPFYCDPARMEYIQAFREAGLNAMPGYNTVMPGIALMATRYKNNMILIPNDERLSGEFMKEIYTYVYARGGKDEPMKDNDDVMDADRYAVASDFTRHAEGMQTADDKLQMLSRYGLI